MKVLVSGGTSLVGGSFLRLLREDLSGGYQVRCLVRSTSHIGRLGGVELIYGDARDAASVEKALEGMDAFVHIAGIEYTPQVLEAMNRTGVERLVIVSSTSAHSRFEFRSAPKLEMEAQIRRSSLKWTVVRPSMIYGSELDRNIHKLLRFLDRSPIFPMFGSGENLWQPVYYEDLAQGVVAAFEREEAVGQIYDLPGAQALSYIELVRVAARALGRSPRIVSIPAWPVHRMLEVVETARIPLPIKSEQVLRLSEDKAYPYEKAKKELGYFPRTFEEGVTLEVERLREIGMVG